MVSDYTWAEIETARDKHPRPSRDEELGWPRRVDEAVDEIARELGLTPIMYAAKPDAYARYIAPYRLEMLLEAIKADKEVGLI